MSKNVIIHENSFKKFKEEKKKKENWLKKETSSFKYTQFSYKTPKMLAEEKLEEINLNFTILDDKYASTTDALLCICDNEGKTLWMNKFLQNLAFQGETEIYLKPLFDTSHFSYDNSSEFPLQDTPKSYEKNDIIVTEEGESHMQMKFVNFDSFNMFRKDCTIRVSSLDSLSLEKGQEKPQI